MDRDTLIARLSAEIEAARDDLVRDTSRLLQFESISGSAAPKEREHHAREMTACAAFVRERAEALGARWIEKPGRWYCAEWPATPKAASAEGARPITLAVVGHLDVVPAGGVWTHPPFSGAVADGYVWGRGAVDMKGPLAACLHALGAVRRIDLGLPVAYRLILGVQEEINDWSDLEEYLAEQGPPDFAFTPDARFPVVLGEKGTLILSLRCSRPQRTDTKIKAEIKAKVEERLRYDPGPDRLEVQWLRGGVRGNVVPDSCEIRLGFLRRDTDFVVAGVERAARAVGVGVLRSSEEESTRALDRDGDPGVRVVIDRTRFEPLYGDPEFLEWDLRFLGQSAHGSTPERGRNAVVAALRMLLRLEPLPDFAREFARFLLAAGEGFDGRALGLASTHEFLGPTTVNLGMAFVSGTRCEAMLNVRPTLGLSAAEARARLERAARSFAPEVLRHWEFQAAPMPHDAQCLDPKGAAAPFLAGLREGLAVAVGRALDDPELRDGAVPYTTYAKAMANCCAFGPILHAAGEVEMAHEPDERVAVDSLVRNARIFALALAFAGRHVAAAAPAERRT